MVPIIKGSSCPAPPHLPATAGLASSLVSAQALALLPGGGSGGGDGEVGAPGVGGGGHPQGGVWDPAPGTGRDQPATVRGSQGAVGRALHVPPLPAKGLGYPPGVSSPGRSTVATLVPPEQEDIPEKLKFSI